MAAMTNQMLLEQLYQRWFSMADTDLDRKVSGQEAVSFFMGKSGLPQETMRSIWDAGSRGAAWLDQGSFRVICQLIWYAQNNGNQLPPNSQAIVMKIVSGMATLPPPRLAGLEIPQALQQMTPVGIPSPAPGYASGPTGPTAGRPSAGPYGVGPTGGFQREFLPQQSLSSASSFSVPPGSYVASPSGPRQSMTFSDGVPGHFSSGYTGQVPMQQAPQPGQFGAAPTGQPDYPAVTQHLAGKYATSFKSATKDSEGSIGGAEVLRLLASVNVDRSIKKQCWDLVAGSKGTLNAHELFTMLYLLDLYTVKGALPSQLPKEGFPPGVYQCYQAAGLPVPISMKPSTVSHIPLAQQNPVENLALVAERQSQAWSMDAHAPKAEDPYAGMPPLPPQANFQPSKAATYTSVGRMPKVEAAQLSGMQNQANAQRLQQELSEAGSKDKAIWEQTQKLEKAQAEAEFFTNALQELTLFKSRSDRTLLDMQSRAESAHREAQEQRSRYERMFAEARAASSQNESLQQQITEAMHTKAEWESKVSVLQQELQMLANATPQLLVQLDQEIEQLRFAVEAAEQEKAALDAQTSGQRASKALMAKRLQQVKDLVEGAKATRAVAESDLAKAKAELDFTKTGEDAEALLAALADAAAVYKSLHIKARSAGLRVPRDAIISSSDKSVWEHDDLLAAKDWIGFENAGWTLVDDLPELPEAFSATFFLSHAQELPPALAPAVKKADPHDGAQGSESDDEDDDDDGGDAEEAGESATAAGGTATPPLAPAAAAPEETAGAGAKAVGGDGANARAELVATPAPAPVKVEATEPEEAAAPDAAAAAQPAAAAAKPPASPVRSPPAPTPPSATDAAPKAASPVAAAAQPPEVTPPAEEAVQLSAGHGTETGAFGGDAFGGSAFDKDVTTSAEAAVEATGAADAPAKTLSGSGSGAAAADQAAPAAFSAEGVAASGSGAFDAAKTGVSLGSADEAFSAGVTGKDSWQAF